MTKRLTGQQLLELRDSMLKDGALQTQILRASGYATKLEDGSHKYDFTSYAFELAKARGIPMQRAYYSSQTVMTKS